jgi:hypothetical protein
LQLDGKAVTASKADIFIRTTLRERRHQFEDYKNGHHSQARKAIDRMYHSVMGRITVADAVIKVMVTDAGDRPKQYPSK